MEKVAATIMKKLEPLLDQWIKDRGLFDSFTDLYLRRWIHSYVSPHLRLLRGIMLTHGQVTRSLK